MMPAQFVPGAVTVGTNTEAKLFHFRDKLVARHFFKVCVHLAYAAPMTVN